MLLELFYHSIHEHLPECAEDTHEEHVGDEEVVLIDEDEYVSDLEEDAGIED